jgi:hypothetical protein
VTLLGYAYLGDKWVLAVKSAVLVSVSRTGEPDTLKDSSEWRPLLDASREIRTKAMRVIPRLLAEIRNQAQDAVDSIEKASKVAAEL